MNKKGVEGWIKWVIIFLIIAIIVSIVATVIVYNTFIKKSEKEGGAESKSSGTLSVNVGGVESKTQGELTINIAENEI